MAIPEHDECVRMHKWTRKLRHDSSRKSRDFIKFRHKPFAEDPRKRPQPKKRIRNYWKAYGLFAMSKLRLKNYGAKTYREFMEMLDGPYYRKWGKYRD